MKIVINETDEVQEVSEKVASRLINKGKAHYAPVEKKGVIEAELLFDGIEIKPKVKVVKKRKPRKKKSKFGSWND